MADRKSSSSRSNSQPASSHLDEVAQLFSVLSESSRLRILQALEAGPASVSDLCNALDMKQANASKQLGILHQAGLLQRTRVGNQIRYSIKMQLVFKLCDLVCNELHREAIAKADILASRRSGSRG